MTFSVSRCTLLAITAGGIFVIHVRHVSIFHVSLRASRGLIAMIPNLFPIPVFFGLLGTTGAMPNLGPSIIASIAPGIAGDNTTHLMTRLSSLVRTVPDPEEAILRTLSTVGKPIAYASLPRFLGFLTLYIFLSVKVSDY